MQRNTMNKLGRNIRHAFVAGTVLAALTSSVAGPIASAIRYDGNKIVRNSTVEMPRTNVADISKTPAEIYRLAESVARPVMSYLHFDGNTIVKNSKDLTPKTLRYPTVSSTVERIFNPVMSYFQYNRNLLVNASNAIAAATTVSATAYTLRPKECGKDPSDPWYGKAADGRKVMPKVTIAVDPAYMKELYEKNNLGEFKPNSLIYIPELDRFVRPHDTGGGIDSTEIDIYFGENNVSEARKWGRRDLTLIPLNYDFDEIKKNTKKQEKGKYTGHTFDEIRAAIKTALFYEHQGIDLRRMVDDTMPVNNFLDSHTIPAGQTIEPFTAYIPEGGFAKLGRYNTNN